MIPTTATALRTLGLAGLATLVALLAASCASVSTDDVTDGTGETATAIWGIQRPAPADEVDGFDVTVAGDTITGSDSDPAGWTLELSRPGGFVDPGTYSSDEYPDESGTGDLTVTFAAPNGVSCSVGPTNSSVSAGGPNPGDTYAQVTFVGTEQGIPVLFAGVFSADCDGLPGASGAVDGYLFGMGPN